MLTSAKKNKRNSEWGIVIMEKTIGAELAIAVDKVSFSTFVGGANHDQNARNRSVGFSVISNIVVYYSGFT